MKITEKDNRSGKKIGIGVLYLVLFGVILVGSYFVLDGKLGGAREVKSFEYKSQWESKVQPETSCGLAMITNINNMVNGEDRSLNVIREIYPPDFTKYYTIEYVSESLAELGVETEKVSLKEPYYKLLKKGNIIMCIDNYYIDSHTPETEIGRTYKENFKHFVLALDHKKIKGERYIKVFDPYEKEDHIRWFPELQLQKAIEKHTTHGYLVKGKIK